MSVGTAHATRIYFDGGALYCDPDITGLTNGCCELLILDDTCKKCVAGSNEDEMCNVNGDCPSSTCAEDTQCDSITRPQVAAACDDGESVFMKFHFPSDADNTWNLNMHTLASAEAGGLVCWDVVTSASASILAFPHVNILSQGFGNKQDCDTLAFPSGFPITTSFDCQTASFAPWDDLNNQNCTGTDCLDTDLATKFTRNDAGCSGVITTGDALLWGGYFSY